MAVLCEPVQQFGLFAASPRPATHADLQPATFPDLSLGPRSAAGHLGFRSTEQSATWQPLLLSTRMGMLKPSTSETRMARTA